MSILNPARGLGHLFTKLKTKVMVPILTQFELKINKNKYLKILKLFKVDLTLKLPF